MMNENETKFGKFVEQKRKAQDITLRGFASELQIAPAYMSDIEKGRRYPPAKDKLMEIARILKLSAEDRDYMFDLAAMAKENTVSCDLTEYIMERNIVRVALRRAREVNATDKDWEKVVKFFDKS